MNSLQSAELIIKLTSIKLYPMRMAFWGINVLLGPVAQLDACLPGIQTVLGLILPCYLDHK